VRDAGVEVHLWVVNEPARMRALVAAGAAGIVTDRADLAAAALA
jgi:glycerophosphoryl diester phosphodiesterase